MWLWEGQKEDVAAGEKIRLAATAPDKVTPQGVMVHGKGSCRQFPGNGNK